MKCLFGTDDGVYEVDTDTGDVTPDGLQGRSVRCLHHTADGRLWAGVGRPRTADLQGAPVPGVYVRDKDAREWEPVELPVRSQVWSMVHLPDDGATILVGTLPPRLLRSEDSGANWEELGTFQDVSGRDTWTFFDGPETAHVRSLSVSAASRGVVVAALEEGGIAISLDRGVTWKDRTGPLDRDCHSVLLSSTTPDRLLASCQVGIFSSDNCGETWSPEPRVRGYFVPLVSAFDDLVIYSASADDDGVVYRSDDQGESFQAIGHGLPRPSHGAATLVVSPLDPDALVFAGSSGSGGSVHATADGGAQWNEVATLPSTPRRAILADVLY